MPRNATVEGALHVPEGAGGSAWLFLYRPGEGPPGAPVTPAFATAISRERLATDPRFVFGEVRPNPWSLWGLLDGNDNFDPQVDVLAQPGAGDRVGEAQPINVQPGLRQRFDYSATTLVQFEPPAFHVVGAGAEVHYAVQTDLVTPISISADAVGRLDAKKVGFPLGLVDADHDGRADDANGDGVPDLSLQFVLLWQPLPGQISTTDQLIVPLTFDPTPILASLGGDLLATFVMSDLQLYLVPQAQWLRRDASGRAALEAAGAPPPGGYALVALAVGGQFWRIPNELGPSIPSQATRFSFDRPAP